MKLKIASLKNPRQRIIAGDWITYTPWSAPNGDTPVRFNVSGASLEAYKIAQEELAGRYVKEYKGARVPDDVSFRNNAELIAEHLLHGWEGLDQDYSPEVAEELLTDAVLWCARRVDNVTAEFVEDGIKNSAPPSATS